MKENFEEALRSLSEDIKQEDEKKANKDLQKYSSKNILMKETAGVVYEIQKEKQHVIDELHQKIQDVENDKEVSGFTEGEPRFVEWNKRAHRAMVVLPSGKRTPATVGELVTDGEWNLSYTLSGEIPRDIRKRFITAEARRKIHNLADEQIIETEKERGLNPVFNHLKENEKSGAKEMKDGFIAEKLVATYFEKNILDHDLPMKFERADVLEDLQERIDFKIYRPDRIRGVGTTTGVQLTIDTTYQTQNRKKGDIEKVKLENKSDVDDIVLVTLPLDHLRQKFSTWKNNEMRPGGPMKTWGDKEKKEIFRGVLYGIFPEKEISGMWESVISDASETDLKINEVIEQISKISTEKKSQKQTNKTEITTKKTSDEGGQENLDKFANKYGRWFGKKK
ncbi:MAG: hypothetical protein NTZ13_01460 [Candidatus Parcubacteria bacterium]|nr:hypothetical protein [Candidatus Parcubacteria bacterium]